MVRGKESYLNLSCVLIIYWWRGMWGHPIVSSSASFRFFSYLSFFCRHFPFISFFCTSSSSSIFTCFIFHYLLYFSSSASVSFLLLSKPIFLPSFLVSLFLYQPGSFHSFRLFFLLTPFSTAKLSFPLRNFSILASHHVFFSFVLYFPFVPCST